MTSLPFFCTKPMSDGNFNRALLPHTPYHSGLQVGRMQMRLRAEEALRAILANRFPTLSPEEQAAILQDFKAQL